MKQFFCAITLVALLLCCAACGQKNTGDTKATATAAATTAPLPATGWITADSMRVLGGPGLSHEVIGGLSMGDKVEITGRTGDWYQIRFGTSGTGYVSGQYLTFTAPAN